MFSLIPTHQFKKDVRKAIKRSPKNLDLINDFLEKLKEDGVKAIDKKYYPHRLTGKYKDNWEAHIKPDLLIIWFEIRSSNEITLLRIGSHSDLFI